MLIFDKPGAGVPVADARSALMRALDIEALWQACTELVPASLPCHSFSLMFDIDDYEPQQGYHFLVDEDYAPTPVTSLAVSAPYLAANPRVRWYTFSQIASEDTRAATRMYAQDPSPGWRDFVHLAFWAEHRLDAVMSVRIRTDHLSLSRDELAFLGELYLAMDAGLQRVRALQSERIRQKAFEALLSKFPLATAVVDENLSLIYLSPEARRLCDPWAASGEGKVRLPALIEHGIRKATQGHPPADGYDAFELVHPQRELRIQVKIGQPLKLAPGRKHYILTLVPQADAADEFSARRLALLQRLSPGERKVAALVTQGLRNDDIARTLFRSRKTIESHISSIYRKLDVANRTQMVRLLS